MGEQDLRREVEERLGRPFEQVQEQLAGMLDLDWEEVEVVVQTSAERGERSEADVIVDLVGRAEAKPPVHTKFRRAMIRWIGKPWRERENPWDRYKDRIPPVPPSPEAEPDDLDEWTPHRPEDE